MNWRLVWDVLIMREAKMREALAEARERLVRHEGKTSKVVKVVDRALRYQRLR